MPPGSSKNQHVIYTAGDGGFIFAWGGLRCHTVQVEVKVEVDDEVVVW
jgi:hypothetical protein